ncbi:IS3 family transposase [Isosphaeraceae bacterium EP7]
MPGKRGSAGAATDAAMVVHIRRVLADSPFLGEGYRKVWARLRQQGIRTAPERVRRLMREHQPPGSPPGGNAHGPKAHDGTITTETPDEMWGTVMTTTVTTGEGLAHVFEAVDHCTCECVGLHAAKGSNRFEALKPLRQGCVSTSATSRRRPPRGWPSGMTTAATTSATTSSGSCGPGHYQLAEFPAGAGGERLCRAVHPDAQRATALGAGLRHGVGTGRGVA